MKQGIRKHGCGLWTDARPTAVIFRLALFLACAALAGCGNVPVAQTVIDRASPSMQPPLITGPHGRLSAQASAAIFKKAGVPDYLMPHLSLAQTVDDDPLTEGNTTRILVDGDATFNTVFHAIENARDSIDMEFYIFEDVDDGGTSLSDLLLRKRREGVAINIIYDGFGSKDTPSGFFDELRKAGVKLVQFNPVSPLEAKRRYAPNHRDHRKILVVDGVTGFSGGVNLSTDYENDPGAEKGSAPSASGWKGLQKVGSDYWHDTDVEIKGPAVAELQRLFFAHWRAQKGPRPDDKNYFPPPQGHGNELVRIIGSKAGQGAPNYYVTLMSALHSARSRVWLTAAYFVPTDEAAAALTDAARRGVDVRILLPNRSDSSLSMLMQRAWYGKLLKAGVKIYEAKGDEVLHSKNIVVDGVWSVIGSSNFDQRSAVFNDEADVVIVGRKTGAQVEGLFDTDCKNARQITWADWNHRGILKRFREAIAPLWLAVVQANL